MIVLFGLVNLMMVVDGWRALGELELLRWSLYYCCRCYYYNYYYYYYLQFVPEDLKHNLNTSHDSMATAQDLRRALYTTGTVILPPLHKHSTLYHRQLFTKFTFVNLLSIRFTYETHSFCRTIFPKVSLYLFFGA